MPVQTAPYVVRLRATCHASAVNELVPENDLTDDALAGELRVFQRRNGHRYSLDDTLTAWVAARARPRAESALDLGCGIGSVLLMLAYKLRTARLCGLEAQVQSHALASSNIARNGLAARVRATLGDLRERASLDALRAENLGQPFELITGTPPYLPKEHGTLPPDAQRAHARFELRGGVEAYVAAAAGLLAPSGVFVICAGVRTAERLERAAQDAHLYIHSAMPVIPSVAKGELFAVWTLGASALPRAQELPFIARDEHGARTQAALEVRSFFGLPITSGEAPSPLLRPRGRARRAATH
jgi:tRNA1(Val) A37 N6-methylase TrmN6